MFIISKRQCNGIPESVKNIVLVYSEEKTLFDKLLGETSLKELKNKFIAVKDYRYDVMHAHNINFDDYQKSKNLYTSVINQLDVEIDNILDAKIDNPSQKYAEFNNSLGPVLQNMVNRTNEILSGITDSIKTPYVEIARAYADLANITKSIPNPIINKYIANCTLNNNFDVLKKDTNLE